MTATLKSKQTAIATVRNNLRTLASFPTTLIFHWPLPLKKRIGKKPGKRLPCSYFQEALKIFDIFDKNTFCVAAA
jgi:hypothetical protein